MILESLEEGIKEYISHLQSLEFEFWDLGSKPHPDSLIFVRHDSKGRQLYVSVAGPETHERDQGKVQIMHNPRSEGKTLTEEDRLAEYLFNYILKEAGYAICLTDINGKNKGNVVEEEKQITRITYKYPTSILRIGKNPMDKLKKHTSYITDAFAGLDESIKLTYKVISGVIAKAPK